MIYHDCQHIALCRQSTLVGCQVDVCMCTVTVVLLTERQLLSVPEHSQPPASGGRVQTPQGSGQAQILPVLSGHANRALSTVSSWSGCQVLCQASHGLDLSSISCPQKLCSPSLWGSCCGCHLRQLWLKKHSRTRKGAQYYLAVYTQSFHQVPVLLQLSFYVQYYTSTLALVPLLQSW